MEEIGIVGDMSQSSYDFDDGKGMMDEEDDGDDGLSGDQDDSHPGYIGGSMGGQQKVSDGEHSDSAMGTGADGGGSSSHCQPLREQDRFLPIANVARIMKLAVPKTGKIAKDAKECLQECVSEFISFLTSEAADRCSAEKRKTINGEDILFAMSTLGFDNYVDPMKTYLNLYRDFTMKEQKTMQDESEMGLGNPQYVFVSGDGTNSLSLTDERSALGIIKPQNVTYTYQ